MQDHNLQTSIASEFDTENRRRSSRPPLFDWTISLGSMLCVVSFLLTGVAIYGHDEARYAVLASQVNQLEAYNLPPRVSALEASQVDLKERLNSIYGVLTEIRDELNQKQDKKQ